MAVADAFQEAQASVAKLKAEQAVLAETRTQCQSQLDASSTARTSSASSSPIATQGSISTASLQDKVRVWDPLVLTGLSSCNVSPYQLELSFSSISFLP